MSQIPARAAHHLPRFVRPPPPAPRIADEVEIQRAADALVQPKRICDQDEPLKHVALAGGWHADYRSAQDGTFSFEAFSSSKIFCLFDDLSIGEVVLGTLRGFTVESRTVIRVAG